MKKTLVTVENLDEHVCSNKLCCDSNTILTSGAKDLCTQRNIEIVYGCAPSTQSCSNQNNPEQNNYEQSNYTQNSYEQNNAMRTMLTDASNPTTPTCCGSTSNDPFEQVLVRLAVTLKESYGITDLVQLRNLSMEAAKVIKKNL